MPALPYQTTAVADADEARDAREHEEVQRAVSLHGTQRALAAETEYPYDRMALAVELWLLDKYSLTQSTCTETTYSEILHSLRTYLRERGLDLDSTLMQLVPAIQTWAYLRATGSKRQGDVTPSTYNQRIAAISSFYRWAIKHGMYAESNPAEQLARATVQKYANAHVLNAQQVQAKLNAIDCSTTRGLRDYVLLQVALNTGRSAKEMTALTWRCVQRAVDGAVTLTFERCKGGKMIQDTLDLRLSKAFLAYVHAIYGEHLEALPPHAPIWVSFSGRTYGRAIGAQTIADICECHLGISAVHTLRHTFAITMDELGAQASTIQERLGHESATATNSYLSRLKKAQNPHASALADAFGVKESPGMGPVPVRRAPTGSPG